MAFGNSNPMLKRSKKDKSRNCYSDKVGREKSKNLAASDGQNDSVDTIWTVDYRECHCEVDDLLRVKVERL